MKNIMSYLIPPFFLVIILFLSIKIGLMVSIGTVGNLGSILMLGIFPMFLSYILFLFVGSPILWLVNRFYKVTMTTSIASSIIVVAIVLIPFYLSVIENISDYNDYIFNIFTFVGLLLGVVIYGITFLKLKRGLKRG